MLVLGSVLVPHKAMDGNCTGDSPMKRSPTPKLKSSPSAKPGFTLIEILVVVAIIALLVAILLPSLARARAQAKLISCQSNLHQITVATFTYAAEYKGRFPADRWSNDIAAYDWIGDKSGPTKGSLWRYMNKAREAFVCPDHKKPAAASATNWWWSYSFNVLLAGMDPASLSGAHHPVYPCYPARNMDRKEHNVEMKPFDGVPLYAEEDDYNINNVSDGSWIDLDGFTNRHLRSGSIDGVGNAAYHDGHVGFVRLPYDNTNSDPALSLKYFQYKDMCIRTKGGKWVSGKDAKSKAPGNYGILAYSADTTQKTHY
jgi:prepilin-type N-terminal cleavage/methylation domain-containing protein